MNGDPGAGAHRRDIHRPLIATASVESVSAHRLGPEFAIAARSLIHAEDLPVREVHDLGTYAVTRQEIIEFASSWDPQPFHTDEVAGAMTRFGDVIGSGLHTMAILQRLCVLGAFGNWAVIAGRTVRDVQFTNPLRPATTVHATMEILGVEFSHHDRALVTQRSWVHEGETQLLQLESDFYVARRAR